MKKIIVWGSSIVGVRAIEEIRKFEPDSEAVILTDDRYPYDRTLFFSLITKEIEYKRIFYRPNDYYTTNNIQVLTGLKISRVNFKKRRITIQTDQQFDYDVFIIADAPHYALSEIKGIRSARGEYKNGVYLFHYLKEIDQILDILPLVDTVVIQSDSLRGQAIATAFLKKDKDVICIVSTQHIAQELSALHSGQKITFYSNSITEILGEGDVRAVRLNSGKVLASQIVIFPEARGDFRLFVDSPLKLESKICVNEQFQTGLEGVFAVDAACLPDRQVCLSQECSLAIAQTAAGDFPLPALEQQGVMIGEAFKRAHVITR